MNDDHEGVRIAISGLSGTGKTTLYLELFEDWDAEYKFAFDAKREISRKLKYDTCTTVEHMLACVKAGYPVLFDSSEMFPGERIVGFDFFCTWVYKISCVLNGIKLFACDEIQKVTRTGNGGVPLSLIEIMDDGRKEELDTLFVVNKGFNKLSDEIRCQLTQLYIFKTADKSLEILAEDGVDTEQVKNLAMPDKSKNKGGEYLIKDI